MSTPLINIFGTLYTRVSSSHYQSMTICKYYCSSCPVGWLPCWLRVWNCALALCKAITVVDALQVLSRSRLGHMNGGPEGCMSTSMLQQPVQLHV